ncbi:uracil-DNA glycosylase family protein [Halobacteriovorax sp. HLS]|uniref:uracil-DNA glycosylase family protein n=1 Tax=Halobacteriovorax sp. HLS TaxID=2234000 RepID=UPI000FDA19DF|nr:uracil-DNA glycosylase family protein [Halobacteriovorax sp. HLS]
MVDYNKLRTDIKNIEQGEGISRFFKGAIFKEMPWAISKKPTPKTSALRESNIVPKQDRVPTEESLSKVEVLESLKEKVEKSGEIQSRFGTIGKSPSTSTLSSKIFKLSATKKEIVEQLDGLYSFDSCERFKDIKLLIIGESQLTKFDIDNTHWKFSHNPNELLGKMIIAMKLEEGDFLRSALVGESEQEQCENILKEIVAFSPDVVITLGAVSTNLLYGRKEKLSKVHGQCFERIIEVSGESKEFKFVPVFHPELLEINPSMKRTAWIDLQKIMEMIGKK